MDKTVISIIVIVIFAGFLFWAFQTGFFAKIFTGPVKPTSLPEGIVLFYGDGCPHCKNVDDFIVANNIDRTVKYTKLEVPFNGKTSSQLESNAAAAIQKAQGCGIDVSKGISIPFLWDGKNCFAGDTDVINFFKNEAGIY